jgi:hypothetical protein
MMNTIILSSVPGPATSVAINLELHGGSAGGAASPVTTAVSSPAAAKAMQLNSADANACGDKRWIGASVCLATAAASALFLTWLTLHLVG